MIKYVVKRFAQMIVVLFIVSLLVFLLTNFIGDPVDMLVPENATLEQIESARARLGLDKPLPVQYGIFIRDVLHGNFGKSYIYGKPAMDLIFERMPATLELVAVAACLVLCIAIPLGVYAGAYPKRASSKLIMSGSILGISLPSFWVGMMMIYIFCSCFKAASGFRPWKYGNGGKCSFKYFCSRWYPLCHSSGNNTGSDQCGYHASTDPFRYPGKYASGLY